MICRGERGWVGKGGLLDSVGERHIYANRQGHPFRMTVLIVLTVLWLSVDRRDEQYVCSLRRFSCVSIGIALIPCSRQQSPLWSPAGDGSVNLFLVVSEMNG